MTNIIVLDWVPLIVLLLSNVILVSKMFSSVKETQKIVALQEEKHLSMRSENARHLLGSVIAVSTCFFITSLSNFIFQMLYLYEPTFEDFELFVTTQILSTVAELLFTLRFILSFYIFILTGFRYRQEVKKMLCRVCL